MSRQIDLSKPITPEEADYLVQRGYRTLVASATILAPGGDAKESADDVAVETTEGSTEEDSHHDDSRDEEPEGQEPEMYSALTNDQLRALLRSKNLAVGGRRAELIERLMSDASGA